MAILESAAFWIIVAAASELIALSPLKDNSIIQLVFHALQSIKGKKWLTTKFERTWIKQSKPIKTRLHTQIRSSNPSFLRKGRLVKMAGAFDVH